MASLILTTLLLVFVCREVVGHGYMLDPPSRSSLWRFDSSAPVNYNDNELFCGGAFVHHNANKGKCGVCGDNYQHPVPRANENTGKYGRGKVVDTYKSGSVFDAFTRLTTNHKGTIGFGLCVLNDPSRPEQEDCFKPLKLANGNLLQKVTTGVNNYTNQVQLPAGLKCQRCVIRWTYTTGNNWGQCGDGTSAAGCGPQETFKNCADVSIV